MISLSFVSTVIPVIGEFCVSASYVPCVLGVLQVYLLCSFCFVTSVCLLFSLCLVSSVCMYDVFLVLCELHCVSAVILVFGKRIIKTILVCVLALWEYIER